MMRKIPIVTKSLLIINVVIFLLTVLYGGSNSEGYSLNNICIFLWLLTSSFISC